MAGIQDLARVGELEFEEVQELELKFSEDLQRVFEGKQADFGNHLRGMLFELWSRARGTKSDVVKELEELRQLRGEKKDLEALIADGIKAQLPAVAEQFKSTFDNVLNNELGTHLVSEFQYPNNSLMDDALADALMRIIQLGDGLECVKEFAELIIKNTGSSTFPELEGTEEDQTQLNLRKRLEFEGLVPPKGFDESWKWAPVFVNTETGERAAFHHWDWQQRYDPDSEEVRVPLAWDGIHWYFPNPRPRGQEHDILHLKSLLTIFIDGVEQDSSCFDGWVWEWAQVDGISVVHRVQHLPTFTGNEVVEARYRVVRDYRAG
jgi:hypothetical protein